MDTYNNTDASNSAPISMVKALTICGIVALTLVAAVVFYNQAGTEENAADSKSEYTVVSTVPPLKWLVQEVGGDRIHSTGLLKAGQSPHTYAVLAKDAKRAQNAIALYYVDSHLDGWATEIRSDHKEGLLQYLSEEKLLPNACTHDHSHDHAHKHIHADANADYDLGTTEVKAKTSCESCADCGHDHSTTEVKAKTGCESCADCGHDHSTTEVKAKTGCESCADCGHDHSTTEVKAKTGCESCADCGHDHSTTEVKAKTGCQSCADCGHSHNESSVSNTHVAHDHGYDPHFWLDPMLMAEAADAVAASLSKLDPEGAENYRANAADLRQRLVALDDELATKLQPLRGQGVIQYHPSFNYFLKRYGMIDRGSVELFPGKEPSIRYLEQLAGRLAEHHTLGIFMEPQLNDSAARKLARVSGSQLIKVDPLGGTETTSDYFDLMRYNVQQLLNAYAAN